MADRYTRTYRQDRRGVLTDGPLKRRYTGADDDQLVRRAIARWKRGKGGINTQRRLRKAGVSFANQNPQQPGRKQGGQRGPWASTPLNQQPMGGPQRPVMGGPPRSGGRKKQPPRYY